MRYSKGVILSFDLVTENLRKYYSKKNPQSAYKQIKNYLSANNFGHLKDSDYRHETLTREEAFELLAEYSEENKWFAPSLAKLNISPNVPVIDVSPEIKLLHSDMDWIAQKDKEYCGLKEIIEEDDCELEM